MQRLFLIPRRQLFHRIATPYTTRPPITAYSRTMATAPENSANPTSTSEIHQTNATASSQASEQALPLPAPSAESSATQIDVSTGQAVKLDHLGPMVVNRDGTLSRISNWEQMSEIERRNTLRILGKRNQLRLDNLRGQEDNGGPAGQ